MKDFRKLRADEIDLRIGQIKEKGLSLLCYKDARCDMNVLDETVGPMNWKREHTRDNKNCVVSIWDKEKKEWVSKEDTGTESNTEAEKGLASDSFKRACVNWGIGRELYTAPFIWIKSEDCDIKKFGEKFRCNDKFRVAKLTYKSNGDIDGLAIINERTGRLVFTKMPVEKHEEETNAAKEKEDTKKRWEAVREGRADDAYEARREAKAEAKAMYQANTIERAQRSEAGYGY